MPCTCDDVGVSGAALEKKLDRLTRLLCEACQAMEDEDVALHWSEDLSKWWKAHQKADKNGVLPKKSRRIGEKLRKRGLAKLDRWERAALGLK